jgi:hypothetical protein
MLECISDSGLTQHTITNCLLHLNSGKALAGFQHVCSINVTDISQIFITSYFVEGCCTTFYSCGKATTICSCLLRFCFSDPDLYITGLSQCETTLDETALLKDLANQNVHTSVGLLLEHFGVSSIYRSIYNFSEFSSSNFSGFSSSQAIPTFISSLYLFKPNFVGFIIFLDPYDLG